MKEITKLSDAGLFKKLTQLQQKGLIMKLPDGRYILTEEGKEFLEELEIYDLVREILAKHGAKELKADLELTLRLERKERILILTNILHILLRIRADIYAGLIRINPRSENKLYFYVDVLSEWLNNLGENVYKYNPKLKRLSNGEYLHYYRREIEEIKESIEEIIGKLEKIKADKRGSSTLILDIHSIRPYTYSPYLDYGRKIDPEEQRLKSRLQELKENIVGALNNNVNEVKELMQGIDFQKLTPNDRKLVVDVNEIVEEYLRETTKKIEEYKSIGERKE